MPNSLFAPVARVERELDSLLPSASAAPSRLHRAIRYSLFAGGKRLRPILAVHAFRACGGRGDLIWPAASALEMIHVYSLIHDDLPAMDDDDVRRGRPTVHRKFDEATAILAGDSLLTLAFGVVAEKLPAGLARAASVEIARGSGTAGMIGGQALDLAAEGRRASVPRVETIHRLKTAALITASVRVGGIVARAGAARLSALTRYGRALGLAFQIVDDILDETGDAKTLGKPVRRDRENGKMTYTRAAGLEKARSEAARLARRARRALAGFGPAADSLRGLADFVHQRSF